MVERSFAPSRFSPIAEFATARRIGTQFLSRFLGVNNNVFVDLYQFEHVEHGYIRFQPASVEESKNVPQPENAIPTDPR